jgi:hypothetical protein
LIQYYAVAAFVSSRHTYIPRAQSKKFTTALNLHVSILGSNVDKRSRTGGTATTTATKIMLRFAATATTINATTAFVNLRHRINELELENGALRREMSLFCTETMPQSLALTADASTSTSTSTSSSRSSARKGAHHRPRVLGPVRHPCRYCCVCPHCRASSALTRSQKRRHSKRFYDCPKCNVCPHMLFKPKCRWCKIAKATAEAAADAQAPAEANAQAQAAAEAKAQAQAAAEALIALNE